MFAFFLLCIGVDLLAVATNGLVNKSEHLRYCRNGQKVSFYKEDFRTKVIYGETYDNFCFTHDLTSMQCCLDTSLDIDSSASIIDFEIYSLSAKFMAPSEGLLVEWVATKESVGTVTADRQCVSFGINQTKDDEVKVKIIYQNTNSAVNRTALFVSSIYHPEIPYSIQYSAPSVEKVPSTDSHNSAVFSVEPNDISRQYYTPWWLCACVHFPGNQKTTCEVKSYSAESTKLVWEKPFDELPRGTVQLCFAVAKLGTFGSNRTCVSQNSTGQEASAEPLSGPGPKSYNRLAWIVPTILGILLLLVSVGVIVIYKKWANVSTLVDTNSDNLVYCTQNNSRREASEIENEYESPYYASDHPYEYIATGSTKYGIEGTSTDSAIETALDQNTTDNLKEDGSIILYPEDHIPNSLSEDPQSGSDESGARNVFQLYDQTPFQA